MPPPSEQVRATRILLTEVCAIFADHLDDAVIVGGWVPELRFPDAYPAHVGSVDVDVVLRLEQAAYDAVVALLKQLGFRAGKEKYQFLKDVPLPGGRAIVCRLDLLTSPTHLAHLLPAARPGMFAIPGAETAFVDSSVEAVDNAGSVRVAGIVALIIMKCLVMAIRDRAKDAYDLHFCLQHFRGGLAELAAEFRPFLEEESVRKALAQLGAQFRDEEDEGPRKVVEIEAPMGEARAQRKTEVYLRVQDFLDEIKKLAP